MLGPCRNQWVSSPSYICIYECSSYTHTLILSLTHNQSIAQMLVKVGIIDHLCVHLSCLEFEARKDGAMVFNSVLRKRYNKGYGSSNLCVYIAYVKNC